MSARFLNKRPAIYNHGRWLIACARCSIPLPARDDGVVCPVCHPEMTARYNVPLASPPYPQGATRSVPDTIRREQARARADAQGEVYYPDYPKEKAKIEAILRGRKIQNMNWVPGESLAFLIEDNLRHGDPVPKEFIDVI